MRHGNPGKVEANGNGETIDGMSYAGGLHVLVRNCRRRLGMAELVFALTLLSPFVSAFASVGDRVIPLESWGKRARHDFTAESVRFVKSAGFTGVFVNGGSGFGADQMPMELSAESEVLPRLAPLTVRANKEELSARAGLLAENGMDAWWCLWGVIGPDESDRSAPSGESNRLFDRKSKLEMKAELIRTPGLFGRRRADVLSWRGSRPLCLSSPVVREFYREVAGKAVAAYRLKGMVFFPGDHGPECCDDCCERCRASGVDAVGRMIRLANDVFAAARKVRPDFRMYMVAWNSGRRHMERYRRELAPGIGLAQSISDGVDRRRAVGKMRFGQPWVVCPEPGPEFLKMVKDATAANRPLMAIGEVAQAEMWDPIHNMPNARDVATLFKNLEAIPAKIDLLDFWGQCRPFTPHANFAAMRAVLADSSADIEAALDRAARDHYALAPGDSAALRAARDAWAAFEAAERDSSLVSWPQRFSHAIGRNGARGHLFRALVPPYLERLPSTWAFRASLGGIPDFEKGFAVAMGDRDRFGAAAGKFRRLADVLAAAGNPRSAVARAEGYGIALAGELYGSIARTVAAGRAYAEGDVQRLRRLITEELEARTREVELSEKLPPECGVNVPLVEEDMQNMRLYLSLDSFPSAPPGIFDFTPSPYSN